MTDQKGFTVIELLIYIALFTIIIGGALASAIFIIQSSQRSQQNAIIQEEANFLMGKINWALMSTNYEICPSPSPASELHLCDGGGTEQISFTPTADNINLQITVLGSFPRVLNSDSVKIEDLNFNHIPAAGSMLASLTTSFRITSKLTGKSQNISTTKYLRR